MNESSSAPAVRDHSTTLVVFGILTIVGGGILALLALFLAATLAFSKVASMPGMRGVWYGMAMMVGLSVALIWLGIGSTMARRWARALLAVASWSALAVGVVAVIGAFFRYPQIMATALPADKGIPPAMVTGLVIFGMVFNVILYVVVPALWAYVYSSRHVKATCERRDPVVRWTDRCPLPVLAVCLWKVLGIVGALVMCVSGMAVAPLFGTYLAGLPAVAFYTVLGAAWLWAAWALYRLDIRGWWVVLVCSVFLGTSTVITYSLRGLAEMYQRMGYSQAEVDLMRPFIDSGLWMPVNSAIWVLAVLGYLFYIRRYFRKAPEAISPVE